MEIIYIIVSFIVGAICFFIGWKVAVHPDVISNKQEIEKKRELELEINTQKERLEILKESQEKLKNTYQETQQYIEDAEKSASKIYESKFQELSVKYDNEKKNLSEKLQEQENTFRKEMLEQRNSFEEEKTIQKEEIKKVKKELESLRATKAAAIEAARKEKLINRKQEDYCLQIPIEEQNDVSILKSVRNRITKPRAVSMVIWSQYYQPVAKKLFPQILGSENVCGVYKITNQETNECYIGQAKDVRKRWNEHAKCGLSIDTPQGNKLYKAMQEYGLEHFSFELLEECPAEKLDEKERYFISLYSSDTLGFNSTKGNK